jgi:Fur family peroxide stress response transcriptional regulator
MIQGVDRTPAALDARVQDMAARCREQGLAVTPQRLTVFRALLESHDHPTPEMLYERVKVALPSLSMATVYKVLDALGALGVVREVAVVNDCRRFDANLERHHHLVCTRCKSVVDFYDERLDAVRPTRSVRGFKAQEVSVQILGLCRACAADD